MGSRSRESFQKRAREKARQEKQAEKREKRLSSSSDPETVTKAQENALMEEFATLSARFEADQISPDEFRQKRERIFEALGLDTG